MNKVKIYIKSILIPLILGGIVGLLISSSMDYNMLNKPPLALPGVVFPIVWTILYLLMGISYGIIDSNELMDFDTKSIYYIQLVVNLLWPIIFFVFKLRLLAFIWILILLALVVTMIVKFYSKNRVAAFLQIPYLLWVLFASYLNLFAYILNWQLSLFSVK